MERVAVSHWSRLLRTLRAQQGMSQRDLADILAVDQSTISRWERGAETPSLRRRRVIRDLVRRSLGGKQDQMLKMRVKHSAWPTSLMREGAVFVETSPSLAPEVGVSELSQGRSVYGLFGDEADELTSAWERGGIFAGDLAMTISLNRIFTPEGVIYFRGLDTPYFSSSGDIWCLCEIRRLSAAEYAASKSEMGGVLMPVAYDALC